MKPRHLIVVLVASLAFAGCGGSNNASSPSTANNKPAKPAASGDGGITIDNFKFAPATLTVKSGTKVTVANHDSTAHTATADNKAFDTGDINPGASATITPKAGTYTYHCSIHPFMHGTLVVK